MELSNEIRMSIIISLEHRQYQGMYKKNYRTYVRF